MSDNEEKFEFVPGAVVLPKELQRKGGSARGGVQEVPLPGKIVLLCPLALWHPLESSEWHR